MSGTFLPHVLSDVADAIAKATAQRLGHIESDIRVLMAMGTAGDVTPTAVAHAANMNKVDVSRASARLIAAKLLSGKKSPHDRREKLLRLTPQGRHVRAAITAKSADIQHELLAVLTPHEAAVFWAVLEKLRASVVHKSGM